MDISQAKKLKAGDIVSCPPDRGNKGYRGTVAYVGNVNDVHKSFFGDEYLWITVKGPEHESVWPSNRLEKGKT